MKDSGGTNQALREESAFFRQRIHELETDLSGLKRVEEILRISEERLDLAMRAAQEGLWDWNMETNDVFYSLRWKQMLGFTEDEIEPHISAWNCLLHPDDIERAYQVVDAVMRGEREYEMEFRLRHKDGHYVDILSRGFPVRGEPDGPVVRIVGTHFDLTERKRVAEALRRSEANLKEAQRLGRLGSWDWDAATDTINWSEECYQILCFAQTQPPRGYAEHLKVYTDESAARLDTAVKRNMQTCKLCGLDLELAHKEGQGRWITTHIEAKLDGQGRSVGLRGTVQDVTERKQLESLMLLQSEVARNIAEGIYLVSAKDLTIVYANPRMEEMFGYDPGEMTGKHVSVINASTGGDPSQTVLAIGKALSEVGTWRGEVLNVRKDGTPFHSRATISKLQHPDYGEVYISLQMDLSERKGAEDQIRKSEQFIRNILDTVDEGFIVIDRDFRIMIANNAYCSQAGQLRDDIIGKYCFEISHKINRPCYEAGEECAVQKAFVTGKPHTSLHKHPTQDGQVIYVDTKAFPLKDAAGNVISVIETINNITEKHLLEEERLKNQKLESIGTLAGGIAHDFNNLLQGVFGYITMAKMTFDQKGKALAMLDQAEEALQQAVNLTTQLLTFSKGGKPIKKPLSLKPVIENAAKFALSGSRTDFHMDIDPALWPVNGDEGQLGQVIQNIVLNADQAMPLGGAVKIRARNVTAGSKVLPFSPANGDYVQLVIEDSGVGMPEQYLDKIFDPYFTTKAKGSGLGLATSYSIIRNHDGQIHVVSEVGKGTVFSIYIPALSDGVETEAAEYSAPCATTKVRVLVMDDEELIRDLATELMHALGNEVEVAANGEETLAKYKDATTAGRPFDIVILDLTIRGGMGGFETLGKLAEIDPSVKAIMSSGYSDDTVIANYREHGFKAFLKKPYKMQELREVMRAICEAGCDDSPVVDIAS